jgi:hypothetical protein
VPFSASIFRKLAPAIAFASTAPVSVPVEPAVGVVGHDWENEVPSSVLASNTFSNVSKTWLAVRDTGGQTNAIAKLVVPLGKSSVSLPAVSVAAVNEPVPVLVATAVGVPPVTVNVTVVGLPPPPEPPLPDPPPDDPPQPAINMSAPPRTHTRISAKDMISPLLSPLRLEVMKILDSAAF